MSDPVSALDRATAEGFARVEEQGPQGMIVLRGDLVSETLRAAVADLTGAAVPEPLSILREGDRAAGWMAPDELLLLVPYAEVPAILSRLGELLEGTHHLAADVSDARALFHVTGPRAREVLAKLTPADVSPEALPVGRLRRTRLAQVPAALWMIDEETAAVICFRSVARYTFDILAMSARTGGEVRHF